MTHAAVLTLLVLVAQPAATLPSAPPVTDLLPEALLAQCLSDPTRDPTACHLNACAATILDLTDKIDKIEEPPSRLKWLTVGFLAASGIFGGVFLIKRQ